MTTAIGYSISCPGLISADDQRDEGQAGGEGRHQDRRQAFFGAAHDEVRAEFFAFDFFQMPVMADEHDAVAGGDAEHGHEPDQRPERQDAPLQIACRRRRRRAQRES